MNNIQRLLAIFAHPDDESYRAGGALALLAQKGARVWVLCATRGERGILKLDPKETGQVRQIELECACRALGIERPLFMNYLDGMLDQVDVEHAVGLVLHVIRRLRPQALLTWPPSGVSGHPDHVAVSSWTKKAFRLAADPLAYQEHKHAPYSVDALYHIVVPHSLTEIMNMPQLSTVPDEEVTLTMDVSAAWEEKIAAIQCHASQLSSSPITRDSFERQQIFLGKEYFQNIFVQNNK